MSALNKIDELRRNWLERADGAALDAKTMPTIYAADRDIHQTAAAILRDIRKPGDIPAAVKRLRTAPYIDPPEITPFDDIEDRINKKSWSKEFGRLADALEKATR